MPVHQSIQPCIISVHYVPIFSYLLVLATLLFSYWYLLVLATLLVLFVIPGLKPLCYSRL